MVRELFSIVKQYFYRGRGPGRPRTSNFKNCWESQLGASEDGKDVNVLRRPARNKPKCTFVPEITIWMNDKSPNFSLSRSFFFLQREIFEFPVKKFRKKNQKNRENNLWFPFRWLYNFHINEARIYYLEF